MSVPIDYVYLLTGEIAEENLKLLVKSYDFLRVITAPVSVASFITKNQVLSLVEEKPKLKHGVIILPGMVKWDVNTFGNDHELNIIGGPRNINKIKNLGKKLQKIIDSGTKLTLKTVFDTIASLRVSNREKRMDYFNIIKERKELFTRIKNIDDESLSMINDLNFDVNINLEKLFTRPYRNFIIPKSEIFVGKDFPPALMAEIINAPEKEYQELKQQISYFLKSGADIIDIGTSPGKVQGERIEEIFKFIKDEFPEVITSIDSLEEKEIFAAIENGARCILSIDLGNREILSSLDKDLVLVLIPTNMKQGYFPASPTKRVEKLKSLIDAVQEEGFSNLLVDPILNSPINPGIVQALESFILYNQLEGEKWDIPFFIGGSNVSEMIDSASTGVNAMLATIGIELGAGMLFTTEDSAKCLGSTKEFREVRHMVFNAKIHHTYPKQTGFSTFNIKQEKSVLPSFYYSPDQAVKVNIKNEKYQKDPSSVYFKIMVDHYRDLIIVGGFQDDELIRVYEGVNAKTLGKKILADYPKLTREHVLYLGRELATAELHLKHHAVYIQDE